MYDEVYIEKYNHIYFNFINKVVISVYYITHPFFIKYVPDKKKQLFLITTKVLVLIIYLTFSLFVIYIYHKIYHIRS